MTMRDDQKILDGVGRPLAVGDTVLYGDTDKRVTVTGISDYDVDYNDNTMRAECQAPDVTVVFDTGIEDTLRTSEVTRLRWSDYPDGPAFLTFASDDLEVCLPNGCTVDRAEKLLADYDSRMHGGYRNQQIAARNSLRHACGMGVRNLRKWLDNHRKVTP